MTLRPVRPAVAGTVLLVMLLAWAVVSAPTAQAMGSWMTPTPSDGTNTYLVNWAPDDSTQTPVYVVFIFPSAVTAATSGESSGQLGQPDGDPKEVAFGGISPGQLQVTLAQPMACTDLIRNFDSFDAATYQQQADIGAGPGCVTGSPSPSPSPTPSPCPSGSLLSRLSRLQHALSHAASQVDSKSVTRTKQ